MHFDRQTLYELHYLMITLGKVTKARFFGLQQIYLS